MAGIKLWRELQKLEWQAYKKTPSGIGVFSHPDHKYALKVKAIIARHVVPPLLDVGCGCLPYPSYLPSGIKVIGIDPFFGDRKRKLAFCQSLGEYLPFRNQSFNTVLFATSIDHFIHPSLGIAESHRVLHDTGVLIIWYSRRPQKPYQRWLREGGLYNKHHAHAFTDESMTNLITKHAFTIKGINKLGHKNRVLIARK